MGTTTFYLKQNDLGRSLSSMTKEEIEKLSKVSPHDKDPHYLGWGVPLELHNGNVYTLIFWKGRLMKLGEAPKILSQKYYNKYAGNTLKEYEWTILKRVILNEINILDKHFKKAVKRKRQKK